MVIEYRRESPHHDERGEEGLHIRNRALIWGVPEAGGNSWFFHTKEKALGGPARHLGATTQQPVPSILRSSGGAEGGEGVTFPHSQRKERPGGARGPRAHTAGRSIALWGGGGGGGGGGGVLGQRAAVPRGDDKEVQ